MLVHTPIMWKQLAMEAIHLNNEAIDKNKLRMAATFNFLSSVIVDRSRNPQQVT